MTNIFTAIVSAFLGISQIMPSGVSGFSADWNSLSMNCGWGSLVKTFIKAAPKKGRIIANPRIKDTDRTSTHFTGNHRSNAGSRPAVSSNTGKNIKTPNANIGMKYGDKTVKGGSVYVNDKKIGKYGGDISNKMINSSCAGRRCGGTYYKEQLVQDKNGTFYKGVAPVFKGKKFTLPSDVGENYRAESKRLLESIVSGGKRYVGAGNAITPSEAKGILSKWDDYAVHHDVLKDCYQFVLKAEHEAARHTGGNRLWADIR